MWDGHFETPCHRHDNDRPCCFLCCGSAVDASWQVLRLIAGVRVAKGGQGWPKGAHVAARIADADPPALAVRDTWTRR